MTTLSIEASVVLGRGLLRSLRPKQWIKNLLVLAAPLAAGTIAQRHVASSALLAVGAFTAAAAGGYLLNDIADIERDRVHPDKRFRPLALGTISIPAAVTVAGGLLAAAVAAPLLADREMLAVVVLVYILVTAAYALGVKAVPGIELVVLSSGFVLRPLAGAAATAVRPSAWFLAVCCLAALAIAAGKRQVEMTTLGSGAGSHRASLAHYSVGGLRIGRRLAVLGMLGAYAGWALSRTTLHARLVGLLTLVPVAVAMVRLGRLNDRGDGGAPELALLRDRWLQVAVAGWAVLFVVGLGRV